MRIETKNYCFIKLNQILLVYLYFDYIIKYYEFWLCNHADFDLLCFR